MPRRRRRPKGERRERSGAQRAESGSIQVKSLSLIYNLFFLPQATHTASFDPLAFADVSPRPSPDNAQTNRRTEEWPEESINRYIDTVRRDLAIYLDTPLRSSDPSSQR